MALKVLKQQAEQPRGQGGDKPFPKGIWRFKIETAQAREVPEFMFKPDKNGNVKVSGPGGELLSVWLSDARAETPGLPDVGARKFFLDILTRDGHTKIMQLDLEKPNGEGWLIQRDARVLTNLALALGATEEQGEYIVPAENIVDLLKAGTFNGSELIAQVEHGKEFTKADGTKSRDAFISTFAPA